MTINKENVRTWVEALRSGEYEQGTQALLSGTRYCCLGVACELSNLGEWVPVAFVETPAYHINSQDEETAILPFEVANRLGLETHPHVPTSIARKYAPSAVEVVEERFAGEELPSWLALAALNDNGATFAQIADIIEAAWLQ